MEASGMCVVGAADTTASTYRFCSIPSNARISEVKLYSDVSMGADAAYTVDLWDTTVNGGAVVKAGFFKAPATALTTIANGLDITHTLSGAGTHLVSKGEKMVWECLSSVTVDPNKFYDVVMASTANNSTPGANLTLKIKYTV